jgi:hypothetical protein
MYITKPIVHYNAHLNLETKFSIDQELVANHTNLNCLDPIVHAKVEANIFILSVGICAQDF